MVVRFYGKVLTKKSTITGSDMIRLLALLKNYFDDDNSVIYTTTLIHL